VSQPRELIAITRSLYITGQCSSCYIYSHTISPSFYY